MPRASVRRLSPAFWLARLLLMAALLLTGLGGGVIGRLTAPSVPAMVAITASPAPASGRALSPRYPDLMGGGAYTPDIAPVAVTTTAAITTVPRTAIGLNGDAAQDGLLLDGGSTPAYQRAGVGLLRYPGGATSDDWYALPGVAGLCGHAMDNTVARCAGSHGNGASNGFDAFMQTVHALHAKAVVTVNYGTSLTGGPVKLDSTVPYAGAWDARFLGPNARLYQNDSGLVVGATYTVTAHFKSIDAGTVFRIGSNDGTGAFERSLNVTAGTPGQWQTATITNVVSANGRLFPFVDTAPSSDSGGYADAVTLTDAAGVDHITNGNFDAVSASGGSPGSLDGWAWSNTNVGGDTDVAAAEVTYALTKTFTDGTPYANDIAYWEIGNEQYFSSNVSPNNWPDAGNSVNGYRVGNDRSYGTHAPVFAAAMQNAAAAQGKSINIALDAWEGSYDGLNPYSGYPVDPTPYYGTPNVNMSPAEMGVTYALAQTCAYTMVNTLDYHPYAQGAGVNGDGTTRSESDATLLADPQGQYATTPATSIGNAQEPLGGLQRLKHWVNDAASCPAKAGSIGYIAGEANSNASSPGRQSTSLVNALYAADKMATNVDLGIQSTVWWNAHNGGAATNDPIGSDGLPLFYNATGANNGGNATPLGEYGLLSNGNQPENFAYLHSADTNNNEHTNYAFPPFYGLQLASLVDVSGTTALTATAPTPLVSSHATYSNPAAGGDGTLRVLLVNKSPGVTFTVPLSASGFTGNGYMAVRSYGPAQSAQAPALTTADYPQAQPVSTTVGYGAGTPVVTLPAYTMAALTLYPAGAAPPPMATAPAPTNTPISTSTPTPQATVGNVASSPQANLTGLYNAVGIVADGTTFTGASAVDGCCANYSSNALTAAGFTLGGTFSYGGATFTTPPATGNNALTFAGQTISFGGYVAGARLSLLGFATGGDKTDTVTLHYADGTSAPASLTIPDWTSATAPPTGVSVAVQTTYRVSTNGTQDTGSKPRVYAADLPLVKPIVSFTLPTNSNLHLLAATAAGAAPATATPTSTATPTATPTGTPIPTNTADVNGNTNALQNNGFEFGNFNGWSTVTNATVTTAAPHAGTYAASFPATGGSLAQNAGGLAARTATIAGAWVKITTAGDCVRLVVTGFSGHLGTVGGCNYPPAGVWTYVSAPFTLGPTDTNALVTLSAPSTNLGTTYVDDASVLPATAPQPATPLPTFTATPTNTATPTPSTIPTATPVAGQLLRDPGFESGGLAAGWTSGYAGSVVAAPGSPVHGGTYAGAVTAQYGSLDQAVTVAPGASYRLTGYVQNATGSDQTCLGVSGVSDTCTSATTWAFVTYTFTASSASVTVHVYKNAGAGAGYADDLALVQTGAAPTATSSPTATPTPANTATPTVTPLPPTVTPTATSPRGCSTSPNAAPGGAFKLLPGSRAAAPTSPTLFQPAIAPDDTTLLYTIDVSPLLVEPGGGAGSAPVTATVTAVTATATLNTGVAAWQAVAAPASFLAGACVIAGPIVAVVAGNGAQIPDGVYTIIVKLAIDSSWEDIYLRLVCVAPGEPPF